jgi:hypothetical protein
MTILLALALFSAFFLIFIGFIRFCNWVVSRREVAS